MHLACPIQKWKVCFNSEITNFRFIFNPASGGVFLFSTAPKNQAVLVYKKSTIVDISVFKLTVRLFLNRIFASERRLWFKRKINETIS